MSEMTRVLLVSVKSTNSRGGIAVWTDFFLDACDRSGIEYTLVNTEMMGMRAVDGTAKRNFAVEFARTKRIFRDLNRATKHNLFHVAHLNTSASRFGLLRDCFIAKHIQKKGIPLVTHFHCNVSKGKQNAIKQKCLKELTSISIVNLVLNESSLNYLQQHFGVNARIVPNFIDKRLIQQCEKSISQQIKKVLFVGRVEEAKGMAELYEVAKRFPEVTFELVGTVSNQVAMWNKPKNIIHLGGLPHDQTLMKMDEADIFLFPSHSEGFSVALLESMARGLPAVATDVGAAANMLSDGCGIVVAKGDVDAMEMAIQRLSDPEIRRTVSQKIIQKTMDTYTSDQVIKEIMDIYGIVQQ